MEPENAQAHYSEKLILHQTAFLPKATCWATNKDTLIFSTTEDAIIYFCAKPF